MNRKKLFIIPLIILLLLGSWTTFALAQGDQSGTPGIPGQKPLSFVGAYLADGRNAQNAVNVPLNPTKVKVSNIELNYMFKLSFDKNVVNSLFWGNNSQCFSMVSDSNENIPLKVSKIDDTIDFAQRQTIFVASINSLKPGTSYRLFISPNLQAKNGFSTLGGTTNAKGVTISFKTAGQPIQSTTPDNKAPATGNQSNSTSGTTNNSSGASAVSSNSKSGTEPASSVSKGGDKQPTKSGNKASLAKSLNNADDEAGSKINWIVVVGILLVAAWLVIEVYLKKKKRKSSQ